MLENQRPAFENLSSIRINWDTPMSNFSAAEINQWLSDTRKACNDFGDTYYSLWQTVSSMVMRASTASHLQKTFDWNLSPRQFKERSSDDE